MDGGHLVVQPQLAALLTVVYVNRHFPTILVHSFAYAFSVEHELFRHVPQLEDDGKCFTGQSRAYADYVSVARQFVRYFVGYGLERLDHGLVRAARARKQHHIHGRVTFQFVLASQRVACNEYESRFLSDSRYGSE